MPSTEEEAPSKEQISGESESSENEGAGSSSSSSKSSKEDKLRTLATIAIDSTPPHPGFKKTALVVRTYLSSAITSSSAGPSSSAQPLPTVKNEAVKLKKPSVAKPEKAAEPKKPAAELKNSAAKPKTAAVEANKSITKVERPSTETKGTSAQLKKKKTGPEPHPVFSNRRNRLRPKFGAKVCLPHSSKPTIPPPVVEVSEEEEKPKTLRRKGKEPVDQSIPLPKSHQSYINKFMKAVKDTPILNVRPIKREWVSSFINQVIDRHGWEKWLSYYHPYYPDVVKFFFANLEIDLEARTLTSSILNIPIKITAQDLINHYGFLIPDEPITLENLKVDPSTFLDVETILGYSSEYNPPGVKKHVARKIKHLAYCSDQAKTLGRILQECFLQIHGHKDEWTNMHQTAPPPARLRPTAPARVCLCSHPRTVRALSACPHSIS
ncbi:hypothetical protein AXF42_Ash009222 [Apostasia shenzhenica]|uniref:Uncharacterized protein n=1 Tax=Apostasia shenzhenica TaxID=1088818 RepID=A0A2I0B3H7_9ASPA|nr:hypothetical protein AXF42_Ash009222 [Apostasia shenzhenica]